jgi:hypothetical protein
MTQLIDEVILGPMTSYPSGGPDGPDIRTNIPVAILGLAGAEVRAAVGGVNAAEFGGMAAGTVLVAGYTDSAAMAYLTLIWRSRPWNAISRPGAPPYREINLARLLGIDPPALLKTAPEAESWRKRPPLL